MSKGQVFGTCQDCEATVFGWKSTRCRSCWRAHEKEKASGRTVSRGYVLVKVEGRGWVREHRLIMEQALGRKLEPHEQVHHINEDTTDNRIENLELHDSNASHRARHRCVDWDDVVALYRTGRGCTTVAADLGISESYAYYILKRSGVLRTRSETAHLRPRRNGREFAAWGK